MPNIRTNLLRIEATAKCIIYQVDIACKIILDLSHHSEVSSLVAKAIPNVLYAFPYLYSTLPLEELTYSFFLSNGAPLVLQMTKQGEEIIPQLIGLIANRLMTLTDLLYSPELGSCFNPFEEKRRGDLREIPGFTIQPAGQSEGLGIFLVPMVMQFNLNQEIGEESQVLLDYKSGNFCLKQNIVRIDKARGEIHFRNGTILSRSGLKPITVKTIGGYPLAHELYNFFNRVRDCSISFCESWGIKFDSRFLESSIQAVHPGQLSFRNNYDRSLAEIVTPMSEHNWTNNWLEFFRGGCLEDALEAEIVILCTEGERRFMMDLAQQLDSIRFRMGINLTFKTIVHNGLELVDELIYLLQKESTTFNANKLYLFASSRSKSKQERDHFEKFMSFLIEQNLLFHFVEFDPLREYNIEALAYQHLCIFYTKLRLNPWKIKNIPFSNAPMAVMTLHVQQTKQGLLSVSLISTMNLFLTKFTAVQKLSKPETLKAVIEQAVRECIGKFQSAHNRSPTRIFIFRTGFWQTESEFIGDQHKFLKESIYMQTSSLITYVCLSKNHSLRTFTQLDSNYVSKDSCKRVQALLSTTVKEEIYLQLQIEEPMHRVTIYDIEKNDPNFVPKILELTAKVVFGGVGNSFGKGLGFIDYARKLNLLREYNLQPWKGMLRDGILPFL